MAKGLKAVALPFHGEGELDAVRQVMKKARKRNGKLLSERTVDAVVEVVTVYYKWLDSHGSANNPEAVRKWFKEQGRKYAPSTVQNRFHLLRQFMLEDARGNMEKWRMVVDLFDNMKRNYSRPAKEVTEDKYLTVPELQDLLYMIEEPDTARGYRLGLIIRALFWTGCRVSELLGIRKRDIRRLRGVVKITVHGKGGKDRVVEMPGELLDDIGFRFKGKDFLFEENGKPLERHTVTMRISRAGKLIGRKISAHTLRHSRAMHLKEERGLSADRTGAYLGHTTPATTVTYYYHGKPTTEEIGTLEAGILD